MNHQTESVKKAYVGLSPIGIFAFSEDKNIIFFQLFDKDPKKAFGQFEKGIDEEFLSKIKGYEIECSDFSNRILREKLRDLALDLKFVESSQEFTEFLSEFSFLLTKKKMKFSFSKDKFVIQANNALEDLLKISGLMSERLKEWFGLHYPECRLSQKELTKVVATYGSREKFPDFKESVGLDIAERDEEVIKSYAESIERINSEKRLLEGYVKECIRELAPNTSTLVDELLLAKLVATAGSVEKLARLSSSSIQLIGAEKALFRHLKKHGKSPKYGLIFMSHWIQNAPDEQRGKIARVLSAKIMQSIRIDFYSGRDEKERLKKELEEEIKRVSER